MVPVIGHEHGISASAIGAVLGVFALSAALIRLVLPAIAARFPEWKILGVAMLVAGVNTIREVILFPALRERPPEEAADGGDQMIRVRRVGEREMS